MTSAAPVATHRVTSMPPGTAGGLMTPATGSVRLAAEHFVAASFYLLAGAVGLVWIAPQLAAGDYVSPHVAGITHLFTLGWLTTTIFGALYQLLPVALGAPIRWPRLGHVSFWTFAPGAGLFACGVADGRTMLHHIGIALITVGVVTTVANVAATLPRARMRDVTWWAVAVAAAFLASTLTLGVILLHNLHTGFIAEARLRVLATHLHIAIVGWALVMIVGVSHRLLPMFLLAHGADTRWTARAIVLLALGVLALALGLLMEWTVVRWTGVALLELGVACFLRQAYAFFRTRIRKRLDVGMRFAASALAFLVTAAVLGPIVLARGAGATRLATGYVVTGLLGGVVLYVVGFFYKIVPLLAWTTRYRGKMSTPGLPTVAEMYSARGAGIQLLVMVTGVALLVVSVLAGSTPGAYGGAAAFLAAVLIFDSQLVRIALGGPRKSIND